MKVYTSSQTEQYESLIKCHMIKFMRGKDIFTGPIAIDIWFFYRRPKTKNKKPHLADFPAKTPDIDNLAKAVLDAANKIVFIDDSLIVDLTLHKRYETEDHEGLYFICSSASGISNTKSRKDTQK